MYKGRRALQSRSNDESRIGKCRSSEKCAGSELATICDRIVPRSENGDNHDRFELLRINKLLRLRWRSLTDSGGVPFVVMEFVAGIPIDDYCEEHALARQARIELMIHVARAVDYAQRHLVVHRDLKPDNIFVTEAGEAKLLDFGIAKALVRAIEGERYTKLRTKTCVLRLISVQSRDRTKRPEVLIVAHQVGDEQAVQVLASVCGFSTGGNQKQRFRKCSLTY